MDELPTANKVCGGCCAVSLNTVDTKSSVSPTVSTCTSYSNESADLVDYFQANSSKHT